MLAEQISRRVVILVLLVLFISPQLQVSPGELTPTDCSEVIPTPEQKQIHTNRCNANLSRFAA